MVHSAGAVLAAGLTGARVVSAGVADSSALPHRGDRRGRRPGVFEGPHILAGTDAGRAKPPLVFAGPATIWKATI